MFLSWFQVLCLPLDVHNSRGGDLPFGMDTVWKVVYISSAIYLFFINPLLSSFYEANEDDSFVNIIFIILFLIINNFNLIFSSKKSNM